MKRRKYIPLKVRLQVALRQLAAALGCEVKDLQLDHAPALVLRPLNTRGTDTVPPANDPAHLEYLPTVDHATKTNGTGATSAGSDKHKAAKLKRQEKKTAEFQRRMKMGIARHAEAKPSRWPTRKMRG